MFEKYLDYIKGERSKDTYYTYCSILNTFQTWLKEHGMNEFSFTKEDSQTYLTSSLKNPNTQNVVRAVLHSYAKWMKPRLPIGVSPDELKETLQQRNRLELLEELHLQTVQSSGRYLTIPQIQLLLNTMKSKHGVLAYLLLYIGCRRDELCTLHLDYSSNIGRILTNKSRSVQTSGVKGFFRYFYFDDRTSYILHFSSSLIGTSSSTVSSIFRQYDPIFDGKVHLHPHLFRHTFYTLMHQRVSEGILAKLMGHITKNVGIDTYLHLDNELRVEQRAESPLKDELYMACEKHFMREVEAPIERWKKEVA